MDCYTQKSQPIAIKVKTTNMLLWPLIHYIHKTHDTRLGRTLKQFIVRCISASISELRHATDLGQISINFLNFSDVTPAHQVN
jgi:hypothetical protein